MMDPAHWNKISNDIQEDKEVTTTSKAKRMMPRNYSDWDKYDVEKELLKMELEEEQQKEQAMKNKRIQEKEKKKKKTEDKSEIIAAGNLSAAEKEAMAAKEKDRGNEFYRCGEHVQAVKHYSASIQLCPIPAAYNNRAMAYIKLQNFGAALADCNQVLEAEPHNVKALLRRGTCYENIHNYEQALEDFCQAATLEPDNKLASSHIAQMKAKCKTVRMKIEDESSDSIFPPMRRNVAVNKWGLAKVMCTCNGTPAWALRTPPKCRICEKKKAERKAKQEEEMQRAQINIESSEISETNSGVIVNVTPPEDDENLGSKDHMQNDEKGSGDMKATEKLDTQIDDNNFNSELLDHRDKHITGKESGDTREKETSNKESESDEKSSNENRLSDSDNVLRKETPINKSLEKDNKSTSPETKHKISGNNFNMTKNMKDHADAKRSKKSDKSSPELTKIKNERAKVSPNNEKKHGGSGEFKKPERTVAESNKTKEIRQRISPVPDVSESKMTKVNVASKYKKNITTEREEMAEKFQPSPSQSDEIPNKNTVTSPYEFLKVWQTLKSDPDLHAHAQLLRAVPPSDLSSVLGNKLDGNMLSTILVCLERHFVPEEALDYLNNLILVPRFNVISMFLKNSEKKAVQDYLEKLRGLGHHPSSALLKAFPC